MRKLNIIFVLFISLIYYQFSNCQQTENKSKNEDNEIAVKIVRTALIEQTGYKLLGELCSLGHRLSGSENSLRAIHWAKKKMEDLGFENVRLQPVMVPKWDRGKIERATIIKSKKFKGKRLSIASLGGSIASKKICGEILEVRNFDELKSRSIEAKGKIIFFNRPMDPGMVNTFAAYGGAVDQRARGAIEAAKVGGIGVIIRSVTTKHDNVPHTGVMYYEDNLDKIPAVSIGLIDADFLSDAVKKEPGLKIKLETDCKTFPDVLSYNLIGEITGSVIKNEIVVVGGHFDCWDKGVGAHDDGAGCIQSLETVYLLKTLGIKPKRTIRCIFFINEESGLNGGIEYGKYADTSKEIHIAAIESDRGALTPDGFLIQADPKVVEQIAEWLPVLQNSKINWIRPGGSGSDISPIKKSKALIGYAPDAQRYFDFHHSENDIFSEIHPREFELGSSAIAILAYLISEYGLK